MEANSMVAPTTRIAIIQLTILGLLKEINAVLAAEILWSLKGYMERSMAVITILDVNTKRSMTENKLNY